MAQREMENDIGRGVEREVFRNADFKRSLPGEGRGRPEGQKGRVAAERPELAVFIKGSMGIDLPLDGQPG